MSFRTHAYKKRWWRLARLLCWLGWHRWDPSAYACGIHLCRRRGCGAVRSEHRGHAR